MAESVIHIGLKRKLAGRAMALCAAVAARLRRESGSVRRAVILEPYGMGDLISLEPLVHQLRSLDWQVHVAAQPAWRELFPASRVDGWCDFTAPWGNYATEKKYLLGELFGAELRASRQRLRAAAAGAVGIDPRGDVRSVLALWLAGCRQVWSLDSYLGTDLPMSGIAASRFPVDPRIPRWQMNLGFLSALTNQPYTERAPDFRHLISPGLRPVEQRVVLIPVAPWRGKLWEPKNWRELIAKLQAQGWKPLGLCGPRQTAETRGALGEEAPIIECVCPTDWVRELAQSRLAVTLDTGPMHLAAALGVPLVALFGQGVLPLWAPAGQSSVVVSHQADPDFRLCHPLEENWPHGARFMSRITVDEVLAGVRHAMRCI